MPDISSPLLHPMVRLSLSSIHGGTRSFPHAGYLALTPLKIEGVVTTRVDNDRKPLLASTIQVALRCYEARVGRSGLAHSRLLVDHVQTLWTKPVNQSWAEVGDGDWPFKLVLPPRLAGHSSATFHDYRVFWRVEAVINHMPITGLGHKMVKTCDVVLVRYDAGPALPPNALGWYQAGSSKTAAALRYLIRPPNTALGPQDLVPVTFKLIPSDPCATIRAISTTIERRFAFNVASSSLDLEEDEDSLMTSTTHLLPRTTPPPSPKITTSVIASAESADIPRDERGYFRRTITLQIPTPKSSSHWAIGETMRTELATLRFFLRSKVTLAYPNGALDTFELEDQELCLIAANESERRLAKLKYKEAVARARSRDGQRPPSPPSPCESPVPPPEHHHHHHHHHHRSLPSSSKLKTPRRPHTSAGPRDAGRGSLRRKEREVLRARSSRGTPPSSAERASPADNMLLSAPAGQTVFDDNGAFPPSPSPMSTPLGTPETPDSFVQAWEEELERIMKQSQRQSEEMVGFGERRTRVMLDVSSPAAT